MAAEPKNMNGLCTADYGMRICAFQPVKSSCVKNALPGNFFTNPGLQGMPQMVLIKVSVHVLYLLTQLDFKTPILYIQGFVNYPYRSNDYRCYNYKCAVRTAGIW